ncbi:MAG: hypothetical protein JW885_05705 [Deltaproteobacteria bacterium]|nr:hypothetical protein [Candidatus Zymogenaceae bacterium]
MTDLSTYTTLDGRVSQYKEDYDLEDKPSAFTRLSLELLLDLSEDEIEDAVTDGPFDEAIDAVHIVNNVVHFFNFKYSLSFDGTKKTSPAMNLIRC